MGKVADRDIYKTKTGPTTGPGLNGLSENQGAFRETLGALPPKDVTILDGAITGFEEAALIVDTEGGGAADDLDVISDVISATEKLHPGMLITLRAKDPARVVTVKNSVSPNGINTADGNDIVLSTAWELTLRLVGGRWFEVPGRASAQAAEAQSTANAAKMVTDTVKTTPTPNCTPKSGSDNRIHVGWVGTMLCNAIHIITVSGNYVPDVTGWARAMAIGGGAAGGGAHMISEIAGPGGGGGGSGYIAQGYIYMTAGVPIPAVIGAGGMPASRADGGDGGTTSFGSLTAPGGHGGKAPTAVHSNVKGGRGGISGGTGEGGGAGYGTGGVGASTGILSDTIFADDGTGTSAGAGGCGAGSGGGGAEGYPASNISGGKGAPGAVILEYFDPSVTSEEAK